MSGSSKSIRRAALFATIAIGLSTLIPLWNGVLMMGASATVRPLDFWLMAVALLATGIMPVFCFSLYQSQGTLHVPKRLRMLALASALVLTLLLASGLPQWIRLLIASVPFMKVLPANALLHDPRTLYHVSTLLAEASNLALILLLACFYRWEENTSDPDIPVSQFLRAAAKTTVVVWGLWLLFNLIRGLFAPITLMQLRTYAAQTHRAPPQAIDVVGELLKAMLSAACWFSVPYIVSKSISIPVSVAEPVAPEQEAAPETP